ncbi:hypothetical protein [Legionella septentrionalis]|uniref:hypothetical protein n=2 Tax=Legionella septentrionalis TaxID=2498109 RepID=UPI000F8F0526|nr:hypothetical protein [Legionella septentrionalis]RUR17415.1 hypothetical protein ELY10_00330 [Legionella septentrionalis]
MKRTFVFTFLFFSMCAAVYAHEQWLLPANEMERLANLAKPSLFRAWGLFNSTVALLALGFLLAWIVFNYRQTIKIPIPINRLEWGLLALRIWTGMMLIACSLGFLPKTGVAYFTEPTLFASDLALVPPWLFLQWYELALGILLILGFYVRLLGVLLLALVFSALYLYGTSMLQYAGFYSGLALFLLINGGGKFSYGLQQQKNTAYGKSYILLQTLTGLNFIYAAVSVKLLNPNLDIAILSYKNAFTFGIPYPEFVFLMLVVEIIFGLLFILGWHLRWLSLALLSLFVFLSFNLGENIFAHSFIYGILSVFIISGSYPISYFARLYGDNSRKSQT